MNTARLFGHIEGLAFVGPDERAPRGEEDAIRIGITTRTHPELERVIHIPCNQREEVARLKAAVRTALVREGANVNGNGQVAAAAWLG